MVCHSSTTNLYSDWSKCESGLPALILVFPIPVCDSHVTLIELQSDWNTQILFTGPRIVSIS